ncbi:MAG: hypothetical protein KAS32_07685 [Candidatus Peribacteraceae bacterium]|nr:hypothetical protein [Candidatus Peribacteraceae bacterium]
MAQSRLQTERIDVVPFTVKPMSHNIPGHEDRMKVHCERVQREYFDKGLNHAGRPKKT